MNVKALVLTAVTTAVALVTLVALNLVAPITHADDRHEAGTEADQVFGESLADPGPQASAAAVEVAVLAEPTAGSPAPAASSPGQPAPESASRQPAGACSTVAADGSALLSAPGSSAAAAVDDPSPAPTGTHATLGSAVPGAGGACPTGLATAGADASGSDTDTESTETAPGTPTTADEPRPVPSPEPEPEPEVVAAPEPVAAPKPAPKPAPRPAPAATAKPPVPKKIVQSAPRVQPADTKAAWWPARQAGKLNITYAGSVTFTKAIAIVTDGEHADGTQANQHIKVTSRSGEPVPGQWLVAKGNARMLLYSVPPGVYKVSVGAGMTDSGNRALAAASSGLVWVP